MENYSEHKELFSKHSGPVNKSISNILKCFELFFEKDIIQLTVIEKQDMQNNIKIKEECSSHSHHLSSFGFLSEKI